MVRMFEILRKDECQWVAQADLKSMLAGILLSHPGLEFLQVRCNYASIATLCWSYQGFGGPYVPHDLDSCLSPISNDLFSECMW